MSLVVIELYMHSCQLSLIAWNNPRNPQKEYVLCPVTPDERLLLYIFPVLILRILTTISKYLGYDISLPVNVSKGALYRFNTGGVVLH